MRRKTPRFGRTRLLYFVVLAVQRLLCKRHSTLKRAIVPFPLPSALHFAPATPWALAFVYYRSTWCLRRFDRQQSAERRDKTRWRHFGAACAVDFCLLRAFAWCGHGVGAWALLYTSWWRLVEPFTHMVVKVLLLFIHQTLCRRITCVATPSLLLYISNLWNVALPNVAFRFARTGARVSLPVRRREPTRTPHAAFAVTCARCGLPNAAFSSLCDRRWQILYKRWCVTW